MIRAAWLALACIAIPAQAAELDFPEGAVRAHGEAHAAGRYGVATGAAVDGAVPMRQLEGPIRHDVWHLSPAMTVPVLLATLRPQIEVAGYTLLLDCTARHCGGYDFRFAIEDLGAPVMVVDLGRFGYLSAVHPETGAYLAALVSETQDVSYIQVTRIGTVPISAPVATSGALSAAPDVPLGSETARALAEALVAYGGVVLEDLRFEPGSAALAQAEFPSLQALSELLTQNSGWQIALVGHSDAQGSTEANLALSKRRAEAVRARLLADFDVAADRVRADGVGYLAPRATNSTEDGRHANRRVEAILVLP